MHILQAFESVLRCSVTIEMRCESRKGTGRGPILLPASQNPPHLDVNRDASTSEVNRREIVEIEASPQENRGVVNGGATSISAQKISAALGEQNPCRTLVKSKVSLAHVIQHAEGCSQHNIGWSKRKAVSIAEKLEQDNL